VILAVDVVKVRLGVSEHTLADAAVIPSLHTIAFTVTVVFRSHPIGPSQNNCQVVSCSANRCSHNHLLIQRSAGCDYLGLPKSRCQVDLKIPALQLGTLHDEALVQWIPLCAVRSCLSGC